MKKLLIALCLFVSSTPAFAGACDQFFPNAKEIVVPGTTVLCNTFYATVYDVNKKEAIFSTEAFLEHANKVERTNNFHADPRLKGSPTPGDYDRTGFDRGHLVPAADSATDAEMSDTFLMTNMTPQQPSVNRLSWKNLEVSVREMKNVAYVLTGALYNGSTKTIGSHKVPVPTGYYKIVYFKDGTTKTYQADNTVKAPVVEVPLSKIETLSGIKFH